MKEPTTRRLRCIFSERKRRRSRGQWCTIRRLLLHTPRMQCEGEEHENGPKERKGNERSPCESWSWAAADIYRIKTGRKRQKGSRKFSLNWTNMLSFLRFIALISLTLEHFAISRINHVEMKNIRAFSALIFIHNSFMLTRMLCWVFIVELFQQHNTQNKIKTSQQMNLSLGIRLNSYCYSSARLSAIIYEDKFSPFLRPPRCCYNSHEGLLFRSTIEYLKNKCSLFFFAYTRHCGLTQAER